MGGTVSTSREATPTAVKPDPADMATKNDTEVSPPEAPILFKSGY